MKDYIVAVIKIAKEEKYIDDFVSGKLYMNNLDFFIKSELREVGDSSEATAIHKQIPNPYYPGMISSFNIRDSSDIYTPIFCLCAIKMSDLEHDNGKIKLDQKFKEFGKYAAIIIDFEQFINNIGSSDSVVEKSLIDYNDFNKLINHVFFNPITHKKIEYSHQKEFRLYCPFISCIEDKSIYNERTQQGFDTINEKYKIVRIENLSKISRKCLTDELIEGLTVNLIINQDFSDIDKYNLFTQSGWNQNNISYQ